MRQVTQRGMILSAFALLAAGPLLAQRESVGQKPPPTPQTPAAQAPAQAMPAPLLLRVELGPKAAVATKDGQNLWSIADHVVDKESGRVLSAIVQVGAGGGHKVLVPLDRLTWSEEVKRFLYSGTPEELEELPEFVPEELQSVGHAGSPASKAAGTPPAGSPPGGSAAGKAAEPTEPEEIRNLLASQVIGKNVLANADAYGSISDLLLEPKKGAIFGALVQPAGGKSKGAAAVPWQVMERDEQGRFVIARSADEMMDAPTIELDAIPDLRPEDLTRIQQFYSGKAKP